MPEKLPATTQILAMLAQAPERIAAAAAGRGSAQLHASPGPGTWAANEVLAHLRSCADVWGGGIATLLAEEQPTIRAVNPTTWIKQTDYLTLDFYASLRAFAAQRAALIAGLEPLSPAQWGRAARVVGAGRPLAWTIASYAWRLAVHERPHIKQIARAARAKP